MDMLRRWDFYKKIPEDLTVSTLPGVSLSIFGCFVMFCLFLLEFNAYMSVEYNTDIVMDNAVDENLRINFNITVPDLNCEFASVDVSDITGTRKHNMTTDIYKIRLDQKQRAIGLASAQQFVPKYGDDTAYGDLPESDIEVTHLEESSFDAYLKKNRYTAVNFYAPWCIWCRRMEPVWTRVAKTLPNLDIGQHMGVASVDCQANPQLCRKQFIRAYPTIMLYKDGDPNAIEMYHGDRTVEAFFQKFRSLFDGDEDFAEQKKREMQEQDQLEAARKGETVTTRTGPEGCQLYGHLYVKRVPGNFHVHLSNPAYSFDSSLVNASHIVGELWFGEAISPKDLKKLPQRSQDELYSHRLDGKQFTSYNENHTYVHYIQVVTNSYVQSEDEAINVYKYTVHSNEYLEVDDLPSIMFRYDLSPMSVRITKETVPFYHFITSACAIVGGVFTVIGIIDQLVHQTVRAMNKKVL